MAHSDNHNRVDNVLSSQLVQETYWNDINKKPRVDTQSGYWHFEEAQGFEYKRLVLLIPTQQCMDNLVTIDASKKAAYPNSARASGEFLTSFLKRNTRFPEWIPIKRNGNRLLGRGGPDGHASWSCACLQKGCPTVVDVCVELERELPDSRVVVSFRNTCIHQAHVRAGLLTRYDKKQIGTGKAAATFDASKQRLKGTAREAYCNTDGELQNMRQAQYVSYSANKYEIQHTGQGSAETRWILKLHQHATNDKKLSIEQFGKRGNHNTVWQDVGLYQEVDVLNTKIGVYGHETCDPLHHMPDAFPDGIFVDDMSNLVAPIYQQNLCDSFDTRPEGCH